MNPQYPNQPAAPQGSNPEDYSFIINPAKPPQNTSPLAGNSTRQRVLIFSGGVMILLIVVIIFASILTSAGKGSGTSLLAVAQEQTELARVANEGGQNAGSEPTKALANAVNNDMVSATTQLTATMKAVHLKALNTKLLGAKKDAQTDATLQNAQTNNTYDSTLIEVIQADLTAYSRALKTAYSSNTSTKLRATLSAQYISAQLLQDQASAASSALNN